MFGSWGVGVVLYVGSHFQSFYRQVVTSWGSLAYGAVVLGTCPPLAGYPSGVCLPLHLAMFISVAAPAHALSSCW